MAGDPEEVIIDFAESCVVDRNAIEALNKQTEPYGASGKRLPLRHPSDDCRVLRKNADAVIEVKMQEDPH